MFMVIGKSIFRNSIDEHTRTRLGELAAAVRARHEGNIDYRFSIDAEDPRVLRLVERWDRSESFVEHGKTPEVADILQIVNPRDTESTEIRRFEVAAELTA